MKSELKQWIRTAADKTAVKLGCYFDEKFPQQVIAFVEGYCRQSKAPWFDQPIVLMDWQKDLISRLYGWRNKDGSQRFKDLFLFCPKKQGKSTLISCLSLFHLARDAGSHVAVLARTKEQASIIYDEARNMADLDAKLKTFLKSTKTTKLIEDRKRKSKIQVMAADGSTSGFNCSALFLDEFAAWRPSQQREVWQQIQNATAARKDSLKVILTTAQFDKSTVCYDFYRQAKKIVDGEDADNITLLPIIYEVGEHEDWTDEKNWWKAAPSAGITVPKKEWRDDYAKCKGSAFAEGTFRTLMLNQWVGGASDIGMSIRPSNGFRVGASYNTIHLLSVNSTSTTIAPYSASNVPLTVKGVTSQTADLQHWQSSTGTTLAKVSATGSISAKTADFPGTYSTVKIGVPDASYGTGITADNMLLFHSIPYNLKAAIGHNNSGAFVVNGVAISSAFMSADRFSAAFQGWSFAPAFVLPSSSGNEHGIYNDGGTYMYLTTNRLGQLRLGADGVYCSVKTTCGTSSASNIPLTVKGAVSQTADLQQWQDSTGTVKASVKSDGALNVTSGFSYLYWAAVGTFPTSPTNTADLNVGSYGINSLGSVTCQKAGAAIGYANRAFDFSGWAWLQLSTANDLVFASYTTGEAVRINQAGGVKFTGAVTFVPPASVTPANNGELMVQATSNTSVTIKLKGSDGVVRSVSLTLA